MHCSCQPLHFQFNSHAIIVISIIFFFQMSIYSYTNITSNFALMFENIGKNEMKNNVQISHQNVIPVLRSHFHKPTKNSIKSISMKRISV